MPTLEWQTEQIRDKINQITLSPTVMLFNSLSYLIFFPTVAVVYFLLPQRWQRWWLLSVSCFFYLLFIPIYIFVLFLTIIIDYGAGLLIEQNKEKNRKKFYLIVSIISTAAILFIFKYFNFFNANFNALSEFLHWNYSLTALKIILPIGLSFHTFQSLSYVIEVYRGKQKAERNLITYSLYVMFFPQLVAGPIERPQNLLHQFYESHVFDYQRFADGLGLMLWGFFKKIVIADNAAGLVNVVYDNPANFTGIHFILATVLFAFQIYCDFSGYSDIAIGSAKTLGFDLMKNFDRPYSAKSIAEFWRRWHISLSTWFMDYVYIPVGGNRLGKFKTYRNLLIVFMVSGLWHGANWTFVLWGALHGAYLIIGKMTESVRRVVVNLTRINRFPNVLDFMRMSAVFLLVNIAWIFFRANSIGDGWLIFTNLTTGLPELALNLTNLDYLKNILGKFGVGPRGFSQIWIFIILMIIIYRYKGSRNIRQALADKPTLIRRGFYYFLILLILFFGNFGELPFIYFQF